jgi:hypothetical protein
MAPKIQNRETLPPPGTPESIELEFKATHNADRFEAAKDVAALANALGGTILVGARRDGERLASYGALTASEASNVQRAFEEAVRDRCRPAPMVSVDHIQLDAGVVIAVNVEPFLGSIVGVELKKGEASCGKAKTEPENLYWYPRRVGSHTKGLLPEQLPMLIDAKSRRIAIQLQGARGQSVVLLSSKERAPHTRIFATTLVDIRLDDNSAVFSLDPPEEAGSEVSLPLDMFETAWKDAKGWFAVISGVIERVQWASDAGARLNSAKHVFVPRSSQS